MHYSLQQLQFTVIGASRELPGMREFGNREGMSCSLDPQVSAGVPDVSIEFDIVKFISLMLIIL